MGRRGIEWMAHNDAVFQLGGGCHNFSRLPVGVIPPNYKRTLNCNRRFNANTRFLPRKKSKLSALEVMTS